MKLWHTLTAHNPDSRAPVSLKALLYACLSAFFGWAFLWYGALTVLTDTRHNPYGHPAAFMAMVVTLVLFLAVLVLWIATFIRAPHVMRNIFILPLAVAFLFVPSAWICGGLYNLIGDLFHTILRL